MTRDMNEELNDLYRQLGKIEAKIEFIKEQMAEKELPSGTPKSSISLLPKVNTPDATLGDRILNFIASQLDQSASIGDVIKSFEHLTKDKVIRNTVSQLVTNRKLDRVLDEDGTDVRGMYKIPGKGVAKG